MQQHPPLHSDFNNTESVQKFFCSFSLFKNYLDGDPVGVGSSSQQSLPEIQPFFLPWMLRGLQPSIPPRVLIRVSQASVQAGREASGNATLRTLHTLGLPSFFYWSC